MVIILRLYLNIASAVYLECSHLLVGSLICFMPFSLYGMSDCPHFNQPLPIVTLAYNIPVELSYMELYNTALALSTATSSAHCTGCALHHTKDAAHNNYKWCTWQTTRSTCCTCRSLQNSQVRCRDMCCLYRMYKWTWCLGSIGLQKISWGWPN